MIITLEQLIHTPFNEVLALYRQGYRLSERTEILLYPKMDDVLPHSRSGYKFASMATRVTQP